MVVLALSPLVVGMRILLRIHEFSPLVGSSLLVGLCGRAHVRGGVVCTSHVSHGYGDASESGRHKVA
jgi:hypothetical protein